MTSTGSESLLTSLNNNNKWELTPYDKVRTPHEPVNDSSEITVSPKSLNIELICPICLDMLKNTMATKECLHRFCNECITTALGRGNKECPTCRKKLVSKRSLRPDPNIDSLIATIYPNREEYDQLQESAMLALSKHHSTEALQKSIEEGMRFQAEIRKNNRAPTGYENSSERPKKRRKDANGTGQNLSDADLSMSENSSAVTSTPIYRQKASEIEFILRPHPSMETAQDVISVAKQTRYLKTTANATVDHLAKFLVTRIKLDRDEATRSSSGASFSSLIDKNSENSTRNDENVSPTISSSFKPRIPNPLENGISNGGGVAQSKTRDICKLYVVRGGGTPLLNAALNGLSELDGDSTLDHVLTKMWCVKKPLEMYFSLTEEEYNEAPPPLTATSAVNHASLNNGDRV